MKQGWTQMPSGRWVTTIATKYGWATCHAWQGGQWEVSRGGKQIASGARWSGRIEECMEHAEKWVRNLNLRENTWVVDDQLDINDKLA